MLLSVLIVDDETFVREGLKFIIDWEEMGFLICGEASNGEEAFEKIKLYQPELVLLDIKMPGMSGIEVIRMARQAGFVGEIIILSGYSEFVYAQAALQYGVSFYITKPIDVVCLTDAVCAVKDKIKKHYEKEFSHSKYLIKAKATVLYDILEGQKYDPTIDYNELGLRASVYQVLIYENYTPYFKLNDFSELILINNDDNRSYEHIQIKQKDAILLKSQSAQERFQSWLDRYKKGYQKGSPMDSMFIVYGEPVYHIKDIYKSYSHCIQLLKRRFFCDMEQHVLSWIELPVKETETMIDPILSKNYSEKLFDYLQTYNRGMIHQTLEQLHDFLFQGNYEILSIRHFLIDIFLQVKQSTIHTYGKQNDLPYKNNASIIEFIENQYYLYEILDYFTQQFEEVIQCIGNNSTDSIFSAIQQYIDMNYAQPLKLENIASLFGYNYSYLGKVFFHKMGCSFKSYIDSVRIEKSKDMLRNTDLKIYEIAAEVGYKYVDKYHQKFRSIVNMSPAEFRKKYSNRRENT